MSFFAPHAQYACGDDPLTEFRDMVKALHKANIEVILDVVYNHTAEGGDDGPTFSFRGIDNEAYYILDNNQKDTNYSGCGNTFNGAHPVVLRMIMDSLHFWRQEMHVDGFRFDLAAILSRDESGQPQANAPTLRTIDTDPNIADIKLIAEAWDAGGLYQVGSLAGARWREWNGQFRDDVRRFLRGDDNSVTAFVERLVRQPRHLPLSPRRSRRRASTSLPATTVLPCGTGPVTTASTTRPTGRRTVTAAITTSAGTTAMKG